MKSSKIAISGPILRFQQNEALEQNSPPHVQLSDAYWIFLQSSGENHVRKSAAIDFHSSCPTLFSVSTQDLMQKKSI